MDNDEYNELLKNIKDVFNEQCDNWEIISVELFTIFWMLEPNYIMVTFNKNIYKDFIEKIKKKIEN